MNVKFIHVRNCVSVFMCLNVYSRHVGDVFIYLFLYLYMSEGMHVCVCGRVFYQLYYCYVFFCSVGFIKTLMR